MQRKTFKPKEDNIMFTLGSIVSKLDNLSTSTAATHLNFEKSLDDLELRINLLERLHQKTIGIAIGASTLLSSLALLLPILSEYFIK